MKMDARKPALLYFVHYVADVIVFFLDVLKNHCNLGSANAQWNISNIGTPFNIWNNFFIPMP